MPRSFAILGAVHPASLVTALRVDGEPLAVDGIADAIALWRGTHRGYSYDPDSALWLWGRMGDDVRHVAGLVNMVRALRGAVAVAWG